MIEPRPAGLASRLKTETREAHTAAERSGVMAELLAGRLDRLAYARLLRNLEALYAALEPALDRHVTDARLWSDALRRLPGLQEDLAQLAAPPAPLAPATLAYVERLAALAETAPWLLPAHAYLRYLGDLHGGQVMARQVRRLLGGDGEAATAFYAFGDAACVQALARNFRVGVDALALSPEQADAFVGEALQGFRLHQRLFEELQA